MEENIKMLLEIAEGDTSKDKLITYYINMCTEVLLNIVKIDYLPKPLESCIERKVVQLMTTGFDGLRVTQIDRGDYKVKYEFASGDSRGLFSDMVSEIKPYLKKVRFY